MKLSTNTWTSTETKCADASSIVDLFSQTASIVHQPTLLVFDEPIANLDPILRQKSWHHSDTTANAILGNTAQALEEKTA